MVCNNYQTRCVWLFGVELSEETPAVSNLLDFEMEKINLYISGSVYCSFTSAGQSGLNCPNQGDIYYFSIHTSPVQPIFVPEGSSKIVYSISFLNVPF